MKLEINIEKKHVWLLTAVIVLLATALFAIAQSPASGGVFHPLHLISTDDTGATSVDANGDGVIDEAEKITVQSTSHPNSYKGCIAASTPAGASSDKLRAWNAVDYPTNAIVVMNLVVDGESICADDDGCEFYLRQTKDNGDVQWFIGNTQALMINPTTRKMDITAQWGNNFGHRQAINGDGTGEPVATYDYCTLIDDYPTVTPSVDNLVLLDGNTVDRCYIKICD